MKENEGLDAQIGILKCCDGSSIIHTPYVSVVCGINGPIKVSESRDSPEEAFLDISYKPLYSIYSYPRESKIDPYFASEDATNTTDQIEPNPLTMEEISIIKSLEKKDINLKNLSKTFLRYKLFPSLNQDQLSFLSDVCRNAVFLDNYPNSQIIITIQEMQQSSKSDSYHLLTASIYACCLSLMDAGISMKYMFTAIPLNTNPKLDPEKGDNLPTQLNNCCLVFKQSCKHYISCYFKCEESRHTNINLDDIKNILPIKSCIKQNNCVYQSYKNILILKFNKVLS